MPTKAAAVSSHAPRTFSELDEVSLTRPVRIQDIGRELPAGARGTIVGVWQGGRAYEVEFAKPFPCLVTVPSESLSA